MSKEDEIPEVGPWAVVKHAILESYAQQYSYILAKQPALKFYYIDAFAGKGLGRIRGTDRVIPGSPLRVLGISPKFHGYLFIDENASNIESLKEKSSADEPIEFICGDANEVLQKVVLPRFPYKSFSRVLLFLDPYRLDVSWEIMKAAGQLGTVDFILNFMTMDLNRNVLWHERDKVRKSEKDGFTKVFGNEEWESAAYTTNMNLFNDEYSQKNKTSNVLNAYRNRLKSDAGFKYVPEPIAIKNTAGAIVYHLFFGSQNEAANKVATHILKKFKNWRLEDEQI